MNGRGKRGAFAGIAGKGIQMNANKVLACESGTLSTNKHANKPATKQAHKRRSKRC